MMRFRGLIDPAPGVWRPQTRSGRKTIVQLAKSGDLDVRRQATWGMSVVQQTKSGELAVKR